jgi:hypothetical protein
VSVNIRRNVFVLDNAVSGFDLYQLDNGAFIRTFRTATGDKRLPRQVAFLEEAGTVVGGSDHGVVYVFDRRSGNLLDILRHAQKGFLQMIAVSHSDSQARQVLTWADIRE